MQICIIQIVLLAYWKLESKIEEKKQSHQQRVKQTNKNPNHIYIHLNGGESRPLRNGSYFSSFFPAAWMHKFENYTLLTFFFSFLLTLPPQKPTAHLTQHPWWRNFLLGFVRQGTYNSCALLHPAKLYSQARAIKMCRAKLRQRTHTQSGTQTTGPKACQSFSPPPPEQSKRKRARYDKTLQSS